MVVHFSIVHWMIMNMVWLELIIIIVAMPTTAGEHLVGSHSIPKQLIRLFTTGRGRETVTQFRRYYAPTVILILTRRVP